MVVTAVVVAVVLLWTCATGARKEESITRPSPCMNTSARKEDNFVA